jgi:glutathione S-transferase
LYSFIGSQWAGVAHLALAEKGFDKSEYSIKEVDLGKHFAETCSCVGTEALSVLAENFEAEYLAINPNGTIPSLTGPSLSHPLIESSEILEYLDSARTSDPQLVPQDPTTKERIQQLINLVHSPELSTNLILLHARNKAEMQAKQSSPWKSFVINRQAKLEKYKTELPSHPFYAPKAEENAPLYQLYTTSISPAHEEFFALTEKMYIEFAAGVKKLDSLLVLPYAVGEGISAADLHIVPWLAHALWGAGATGVKDFETLERLIGVSVPGFQIGENIKAWWENFGGRDSFREVYGVLH